MERLVPCDALRYRQLSPTALYQKCHSPLIVSPLTLFRSKEGFFPLFSSYLLKHLSSSCCSIMIILPPFEVVVSEPNLFAKRQGGEREEQLYWSKEERNERENGRRAIVWWKNRRDEEDFLRYPSLILSFCFTWNGAPDFYWIPYIITKTLVNAPLPGQTSMGEMLMMMLMVIGEGWEDPNFIKGWDRDEENYIKEWGVSSRSRIKEGSEDYNIFSKENGFCIWNEWRRGRNTRNFEGIWDGMNPVKAPITNWLN